ncbi:Longitudinals lacking protein, isoforms H/M/V [Armadillidium vulgare]|nr:Longitudinals lacking protein, isoforms H/M/V [Armadillidium vulgare]
MEDGLLSLKWNNHKTTFFEILKLLRDKANFADATLAVEGKFYQVHKLVLSTCSEYFSEIFERTPCKSPVIVLKDVRCQDLESLLDYMYMGEVNVNQTDLALLLKTAECLRIKGLAVPDDDPIRHSSASVHNKSHSLNADDVTKDIPPAKRRKEDNSSSAPSTLSPSRNSSSCSRPQPSSPSHTTSHSAKTSTPVTTDSSSSRDHQPDIPLVKVELEENEDGEETFNNSDTNYDASSVSAEGRGTDFSIDKAEHDPSTYPNANFSSQHTAEMQWEDGENSFPQESFTGDSSSQQTGGVIIFNLRYDILLCISTCLNMLYLVPCILSG